MIGMVGYHSSHKGFWACLRDLPPDMPTRSETIPGVAIAEGNLIHPT